MAYTTEPLQTICLAEIPHLHKMQDMLCSLTLHHPTPKGLTGGRASQHYGTAHRGPGSPSGVWYGLLRRHKLCDAPCLVWVAASGVEGGRHGQSSMATPARECRSETAAASQDGQAPPDKGLAVTTPPRRGRTDPVPRASGQPHFADASAMSGRAWLAERGRGEGPRRRRVGG